MNLRPPLSAGSVRLPVYAALAALALLVGAWHAGMLAWVNDDSFISFRYAKNLALGRGLVYNPGERVEGYTNFLWTMMIAGGIRAGLDPVPLSKALGISFHLLTIGLCAWYGWRMHGTDGPAAGRLALPFVPFAALAVAVHHDANVYATSGLETAMFTFLVLSAFVLLVTAHTRGSYLALGVVFVAMLMTRPDGIVFLFAAALCILLFREKALSRLLLLLVPIALLYLPYWCWRYSYYGYPLPNTFYAKSVDSANYMNGLRYIGLYFTAYYAVPAGLCLGLIGAAGPLARSLEGGWSAIRQPRGAADSTLLRGLFCAFVFMGAWLLFVLRIGGDFMFARFLIPVTPLFFITIASLLSFYPQRLRAALAILLVAGTFFRVDLFQQAKMVGYIADEWQFYPQEMLDENRAVGLKLRRYFEGLPLRIGFGGMHAQIMYYADPELAIECETGLTDAFIAHQNLPVRRRPGHEKSPPISYLVQRGVNFVLWTKIFPFGTYIANADFGGTRMAVLVYDDSLMSRFAGDPTVTYDDVPARLDEILSTASSYSDADLKFHYERLMRLYFKQNRDVAREAALEAELRRRGVLEEPKVHAAP
jgi:hypothetical protein